MKKWIAFLLVAVLSIEFVCPMRANAYERRGHDKYLKKVLFYAQGVDLIESAKKEKLKMINNASYLAIDQFNGHGESELNELKEYGIDNLPIGISSTDYNASGKTHRSYTHRGWDRQDVSCWNVRQDILRNTINKIFDFEGNERKSESFCKLIYYVHILGDQEAKKSYKTEDGLMMDIGGRHDNADIIYELKQIIPVLFSGQKNSHKYGSLMTKLEIYDSKFSKLINSRGGINSDEKFAEYKEIVIKFNELLTLYFPKMLREEAFFHAAFYE